MAIEKVDAPWSKGILLVCQKCGKEDSHLKLRDYLKKETKETGVAKKIRVSLSGCLGVCPIDLTTVGYFPTEGACELYTVDPSTDANALLAMINTKATT